MKTTKKTKARLVWLNQVSLPAKNFLFYGEKGVRLAELNSLNLPIPEAFIITRQAYLYFLEKNNLKFKIQSLLKNCNFNNPQELQETSLNVQRLIAFSPIPKDLGFEISRAYEQLGSLFKDVYVSVRGEIVTFLNIKGDANLVEAVRDGWTAFFRPEHILARRKEKISHFRTNSALVVQKMVEADTSGLILTSESAVKDKTNIVVKAIYGLGELAVKGKTKPDSYWVERNSFEIIKKEVNQQEIQLKRLEDINKEIHIPLKNQSKQKISDTDIIELAKLSKIIHQHFFFPQEIEWAIRKGKIYILQTRNID